MKKLNKELLYKYRLILILLVLMVVLSIMSPKFLSVRNLSNVLWSVSVIGIMASGSIYTIITGGIDLSVGSVAALAGIVFATLMINTGLGMVISIIITLIVGCFIGLVNGILVSKFKVPAFIATMASLSYIFGLSLVISDGQTIGILEPKAFVFIGLGKIFGIPFPVYIMIGIFAISYWILNHSSYGRKIIATGGNPIASELSGIAIKKITTIGYIISAFTATTAGIVLASMTQQAKSTMAQGYEMDVITAIVLGGTSLAGGNGSVKGVIFGTVLVGIVSNAMNLLNISSEYHLVVKGIIIIAAIAFDSYSKDSLNKKVKVSKVK
jgi:ribose/xylose/arabinose/galactoside ABC-type transport system permease subunit